MTILPTIRQLEVFVAVARLQSFSRAAELTRMSQSALSQAVLQTGTVARHQIVRAYEAKREAGAGGPNPAAARRTNSGQSGDGSCRNALERRPGQGAHNDCLPVSDCNARVAGGDLEVPVALPVRFDFGT